MREFFSGGPYPPPSYTHVDVGMDDLKVLDTRTHVDLEEYMDFSFGSPYHSPQSPRDTRPSQGHQPPPNNQVQKKSKSGNSWSTSDSSQHRYNTRGSQRANKLRDFPADKPVTPHNRALLYPVSSTQQLNQSSDLTVLPTPLISRARAEPVIQTGNPCAIAGLKSSKVDKAKTDTQSTEDIHLSDIRLAETPETTPSGSPGSEESEGHKGPGAIREQREKGDNTDCERRHHRYNLRRVELVRRQARQSPAIAADCLYKSKNFETESNQERESSQTRKQKASEAGIDSTQPSRSRSLVDIESTLLVAPVKEPTPELPTTLANSLTTRPPISTFTPAITRSHYNTLWPHYPFKNKSGNMAPYNFHQFPAQAGHQATVSSHCQIFVAGCF
jgi:hypothetical protein